jgi:hypothetical protein
MKSKRLDVIPPDEVVREQAYLVARGVRPLALVTTFEVANADLMLQVATRLECLAGEVGERAIPFVVDNMNGQADCGYAAASWAIDLFRWVVASGSVPDVHRKRIIGLLLGYDASSIRQFEERSSGRAFEIT